MAEPLSKAAPPPPTPAQLAQRRKQLRLVLGTLFGILLLGAAWQGYQYMSSAPERADAKVREGIANLSPGKYERAIPLFDEALAILPSSSGAYYHRGLAKQNLGRLDEALADFERAQQLKPDMVEALTASAGIYALKGDHTKAISELTKLIDLTPNVDARFQRGTTYFAVGQHDKAIEDFTWVIEQQRDAPYAYLGRAKSKRALGDMEGAALDEQAAFTFDRSSRTNK
jgi:tetratricopeptide (TPR) repeat protein